MKGHGYEVFLELSTSGMSNIIVANHSCKKDFRFGPEVLKIKRRDYVKKKKKRVQTSEYLPCFNLGLRIFILSNVDPKL